MMDVYKLEFYITEKYRECPKENIGYRINATYTTEEGKKTSDYLEYKEQYKALHELEKYIKNNRKWLKDRIDRGITRADVEELFGEYFSE